MTRIVTVAATQMACSWDLADNIARAEKLVAVRGVSQQEMRYLGALQKAQRYEVKDGSLLIHVEGMDQPLRFSRSAPQR